MAREVFVRWQEICGEIFPVFTPYGNLGRRIEIAYNLDTEQRGHLREVLVVGQVYRVEAEMAASRTCAMSLLSVMPVDAG